MLKGLTSLLLVAATFFAATLASSDALANRRKPVKKPIRVVKPTEPPKPPGQVLPQELKPFQNLYNLVGQPILWTRDGALIPEITQLREVLLNAPSEGLLNEYWSPSLDQSLVMYSPELASDIEVKLTTALVKYAVHVSTGRVAPNNIDEDIKLTQKPVPWERLANLFKTSGEDFKAQLSGFAPQWIAYVELKAALKRLSELPPEAFPPVKAPKKNLKVGGKDPAYTNLKIRLQTLGYPISETTPVLTKELVSVVEQYYKEQSIAGRPSLNWNTAFWKHISVSLDARIQQIRMQMEKIRWMPDSPGSRHIYVNLALQHFRLYEGTNLVLDMRTINGRSERKSPMLKDRITTVELNPEWSIPPKLIIEDKKPEMIKNPYFLDDNNYYIVDQNRNIIPAYWVDWYSLSYYNLNFRIKQRSGLGNALGVMKFHLTNPYAIYLHDTNDRHLFNEHHRLLSSGCIRLEKPLKLAEYLLKDDPKWGSRGAIENALATTPVADTWVDTEREIKVKEPISVYLMFITVEAEPGKPLRFANDYYGQDTAIFKALSRRRR